MSDFDLDAIKARQAQARAEALIVDLDAPGIPAHCLRAAIASCALCDDDGYRNDHVCDHLDHTEAARRGMAKVRAELAKAKEGKR